MFDLMTEVENLHCQLSEAHNLLRMLWEAVFTDDLSKDDEVTRGKALYLIGNLTKYSTLLSCAERIISEQMDKSDSVIERMQQMCIAIREADAA